MIEESQYCFDMIKKHFNKELVMTKEYNKGFKCSTKCWICSNDYVDSDGTVRDHCHITEKYTSSPQRDCNINLKLNHKNPVIFHNVKNYNSHLIMEEPGMLNLKINVIPNGLEK